MKKIIAFLLASIMTISLCSCSKTSTNTSEKINSAAIEEVNELIDSLASTNNPEDVIDVKIAYDALTDLEKSKLNNEDAFISICESLQYVYIQTFYEFTVTFLAYGEMLPFDKAMLELKSDSIDPYIELITVFKTDKYSETYDICLEIYNDIDRYCNLIHTDNNKYSTSEKSSAENYLSSIKNGIKTLKSMHSDISSLR